MHRVIEVGADVKKANREDRCTESVDRNIASPQVGCVLHFVLRLVSIYETWICLFDLTAFRVLHFFR